MHYCLYILPKFYLSFSSHVILLWNNFFNIKYFVLSCSIDVVSTLSYLPMLTTEISLFHIFVMKHSSVFFIFFLCTEYPCYCIKRLKTKYLSLTHCGLVMPCTRVWTMKLHNPNSGAASSAFSGILKCINGMMELHESIYWDLQMKSLRTIFWFMESPNWTMEKSRPARKCNTWGRYSHFGANENIFCYCSDRRDIDLGHWFRWWLVAWLHRITWTNAYQWDLFSFSWRKFHRNCSRYHSLQCFKITYSKILIHPLGANDLICLKWIHTMYMYQAILKVSSPMWQTNYCDQWPLLPIWINLNPTMDK